MTATDKQHTPAVGDVYEKRYAASKGKRIRLTKYHHHEKPWRRYFDTETITHPASPQMVGRTGTTAVDQLDTQWRHVPSQNRRPHD